MTASKRRPVRKPIGTRLKVIPADGSVADGKFVHGSDATRLRVLKHLRERAVVSVESQDGSILTATPSLAEAADADPEQADWDVARVHFSTFVFDEETTMKRQDFALAPVGEVPDWDMPSVSNVLWNFYLKGELHPTILEWLIPIEDDGQEPTA
ncbi:MULTISPECIES: hypothetical protein [unclassified Pseudoclavibacter]|uniref:hypothetical protein n=1 Tax=unclassified Pseudoclavibacter TaxID=2615177 RepID=UPI001BA4F76F|nr:hypothetical protein [Pseudoclavibacter sp. Marseille-Q4354]MBS3180007.1 hypothetical protein [Pseudoclavibacter sp. Marseille-Q4354]